MKECIRTNFKLAIRHMFALQTYCLNELMVHAMDGPYILFLVKLVESECVLVCRWLDSRLLAG